MGVIYRTIIFVFFSLIFISKPLSVDASVTSETLRNVGIFYTDSATSLIQEADMKIGVVRDFYSPLFVATSDNLKNMLDNAFVVSDTVLGTVAAIGRSVLDIGTFQITNTGMSIGNTVAEANTLVKDLRNFVSNQTSEVIVMTNTHVNTLVKKVASNVPVSKGEEQVSWQAPFFEDSYSVQHGVDTALLAHVDFPDAGDLLGNVFDVYQDIGNGFLDSVAYNASKTFQVWKGLTENALGSIKKINTSIDEATRALGDAGYEGVENVLGAGNFVGNGVLHTTEKMILGTGDVVASLSAYTTESVSKANSTLKKTISQTGGNYVASIGSVWGSLIERISDSLVPLFVSSDIKIGTTKILEQKNNSNTNQNIIAPPNAQSNKTSLVIENPTYFTIDNQSTVNQLRYDMIALNNYSVEYLKNLIALQGYRNSESIYKTFERSSGGSSKGDINADTLSIGTLSGVLSAVNGDVSASPTLAAAFGGTGISTVPSYGQLLMGNSGGTYDLVSTSTLGISGAVDSSSYFTLDNWFATTTDALQEGSTNLYFTNDRADARVVSVLSATTTLPNILTLSGLNSFGTLGATTTSAGDFDVAGNINFTGALLQNGSPFAGSQWNTNGSDISYSAGNVGIGITSPSQKLDVGGNILAGSGAGSAYVYLRDEYNYIYNADGMPVDIRGHHGVRSYNDLGEVARFGISGGSLDSYFNGNVGIGTTNPNYALTLSTAGATIGIADQLAYAAPAGALTITGGTGTAGGNAGGDLILKGGNSYTGSPDVAGDVKIYGGINNFSAPIYGGAIRLFTSGIEQFTLLNDGNVGIGTTTPGQKLSVSGDILGNQIIGSYFTATSSEASVFQYASTTALTVGGTSYLGTVASGVWNGSLIGDAFLTKSGDWTGTFDGQEGSYYLNAINLVNFGVPFYNLLAATTTDALAEGSTNKYYSDAGARSAISATAPLSYNSTTGVFTTSMNTNKLIGRGTSGTGVMEEITLGTGLSLSGTTLNASGGIDGTLTANELVYGVDSDTVGSLSTATYPSLTELSYAKGVTSAIQTQLNNKQDALVSATNIKTINGSSVLGSGDLTVSGTMAIGGSVTSATAGSVLFTGTSGVLAQNNSKMFWDNTNYRLGIGTASPSTYLHVFNSATTNIELARFGATSSYGSIGLDAAGYMKLSSAGSSHTLSIGSVGVGIDASASYPLDVYGGTNSTIIRWGPNSYDGRAGVDASGVPWVGTGFSNAFAFYNGGTETARFTSGKNFGIGTGATVSAKLHIISTTPQFRSGYDVSNYWTASTTSTGAVVFDAVGSGANFSFSDNVGVGTVTPGAQFQVNSASAATISQIIKGATSQTADLTQWQNSAGTIQGLFAGGLQTDNTLGVFTIYDKGVAKSSDGAILSVHADDSSPYLAKFYNETKSTTAPVFTYYADNSGNFIQDVPTGSHTINASGAGGILLARKVYAGYGGNFIVGASSGTGLGLNNVFTTNSVKSVIAHSESSAATAPTTITSSWYQGIGGGEYTTNSYRLTGYGYKTADLNTYPAYIGYQEMTASGNTYGDLIFGTRSVTTDTAPTERLRIGSSGNIGIGTSTPWKKLSVVGGVAISGLSASGATDQNVCINPTTFQITYGASCLGSSERFKHNITDLNEGLDFINSIRPVAFEYNENNQKSIGFIAEEIAPLDPRLVFYDADGVTPRGITYEKFVPILTKAIQEIWSQMQTVLSWFGEGKFKVQGDICVDDVCVSKEAFKQMLLNNGASHTTGSTNNTPPSGDDNTSTTTEETVTPLETISTSTPPSEDEVPPVETPSDPVPESTPVPMVEPAQEPEPAPSPEPESSPAPETTTP